MKCLCSYVPALAAKQTSVLPTRAASPPISLSFKHFACRGLQARAPSGRQTPVYQNFEFAYVMFKTHSPPHQLLRQ